MKGTVRSAASVHTLSIWLPVYRLLTKPPRHSDSLLCSGLVPGLVFLVIVLMEVTGSVSMPQGP